MVGTGPFTYEPHADWDKRPRGHNWMEAVGVAVDSRNRVFVFSRGPHPIENTSTRTRNRSFESSTPGENRR